ncbi:hypothetical protein V2J09_007606 [Rumex salicifolius]
MVPCEKDYFIRAYAVLFSQELITAKIREKIVTCSTYIKKNLGVALMILLRKNHSCLALTSKAEDTHRLLRYLDPLPLLTSDFSILHLLSLYS